MSLLNNVLINSEILQIKQDPFNSQRIVKPITLSEESLLR